MKKSKIIDLFWEEGCFNEYRSPKDISEKIWKEYGVDAGNITMALKSKSYLKNYPKKGWRQIKPFEKKIVKKRKTRTINFFDLLEIHPKIKEVSEKWFNQGDYDVAIERAFKRVIKLVQNKSGKNLDGASLMQHVFSIKKPILVFNSLKTQSEIDEQRGMMDLFSGAVSCIRNVRFHEELENDEKMNSLHQIIFASFLAKRLDESKHLGAFAKAIEKGLEELKKKK